MINRTPPGSKPPSSVISSYKRRQQTGPFILWGVVILLVVAGLIFLVIWLSRPTSPIMTMFSTQTPTPTVTATTTSTITPTETATVTETATITTTPTASQPFDYTIQENDNLFGISEKFELGANGIALILYLNPYDPTAANPGIDPATKNISVGQVIKIPNPGMQLPTSTPFPTGMAAGTQILYIIQTGETLEIIASKFNSTVEDIQKLNDITEANSIQAGQQIKVRVNLVTPTATKNPSITPGPSPTPPNPLSPTLTLTPTP